MKLPNARSLAFLLRPRHGFAQLDGRSSVLAVVCLLSLLFAGCSHKPQPEPLAPPIVDVPPPNPSPSPVHLPPPVITIPKETPEPSASLPPRPAPPAVVKKKKHTPPPTPAPQISARVSAIGQLSSGDPANLQSQTIDSLAATESGLNSLHRSLTDQEKKTAAQIKTFLKQAHAAMRSGDIDGAYTLAVKAKVLLGELSQ